MMNDTLSHRPDEEWPAATATVQRNPGVVFQPMDAGAILVHMETDRIYELNATATRLWELLDTTCSIPAIRQQMLSEFDVDETVLQREIASTLQSLVRSELVIISAQGDRATG